MSNKQMEPATVQAEKIVRACRLWAILALATIASHLLARALGPNTHPSSIDVPPEVLDKFSPFGSIDADRFASISLDGIPDPSASSAIAMIAFFLIVGLIFSNFTCAGAFSNFAKATILAALLIFSSLVITITDEVEPVWRENTSRSDDGTGHPGSPRFKFLSAANWYHDYDAVHAYQNAVNLGHTTVGMYVLAQVAIANGDAKSNPKRLALANLALASPPVGPVFTPTGQALYAIETAIFGVAKSPTAVAYQDRRLSWQWWPNVATVILGVLTLAVGGAALLRIFDQRNMLHPGLSR